MLKDFVSLIFPTICAACGESLYKNEQSICTYCRYHLPTTNYHLQSENPVSSIFWGRAPIHSAAAYYNFGKGGKVQHLIHELKYNGNKEVGTTLGKMYGIDLMQSDLFNTADTVIPVPLHAQKLKKRGYNQSEFFAAGIAESMNIPADLKTLIRAKASETQTKKSRFSRWENVKTIFQLTDEQGLKGKHILLVDDVITTGSTVEACAHTLLKIPDVKISIAAIAFANNG